MSDDSQTAFPASAATPGQAESRSAYKRFMANSGLEDDERLRAETAAVWGNDEPPTWLEMYLQLRADKWDWRKAAFIAWSACPTDKRWPKTVSDLAVQVLGLKSDRAVRKWREDDPKIDATISRLLISEMMDHRQDAIQAMIKVASTPEASGFNDRKLLLKITGMVKDESAITLSGPDGEPIEVEDRSLKDLSNAELDRVIANLQAAANIAG